MIKNYIENELKKKRLSKPAFAKQINMNYSAFMMALKSNKFTLERLIPIAEVLNVDLDELINLNNKEIN